MKPTQSQVHLVDLTTLFPHPDYQRNKNKQHLKRIIAAFDESLVGVLMVSPRPQGGYWVWDGQHRTDVLTTKGYTHWWCIVTPKTPNEQAAAFVMTNDLVLRANPLDKHRAAVFQKDIDALAVEVAVRQAGCFFGTGGAMHIRSVRACYDAYHHYGSAVLTDTLNILSDTWSGPESKAAALVGGISRLIHEWPEMDHDILAAVLRSTHDTPGEFVGQAQANYSALGGSKGFNQFRYAWELMRDRL